MKFLAMFLSVWVAGALLVGVVEGYVLRVTVTREARDLYKVNYMSSPIWIVTWYCAELAFFDDALLDYEKYTLHFIKADVACDVKKIR